VEASYEKAVCQPQLYGHNTHFGNFNSGRQYYLLVEVYDYDSEQIICVPASVAEDFAEQDSSLEIIGQ
jgi:hypothetical protein